MQFDILKNKKAQYVIIIISIQFILLYSVLILFPISKTNYPENKSQTVLVNENDSDFEIITTSFDNKPVIMPTQAKRKEVDKAEIERKRLEKMKQLAEIRFGNQKKFNSAQKDLFKQNQ
jgi:hypothetical protein